MTFFTMLFSMSLFSHQCLHFHARENLNCNLFCTFSWISNSISRYSVWFLFVRIYLKLTNCQDIWGNGRYTGESVDIFHSIPGACRVCVRWVSVMGVGGCCMLCLARSDRLAPCQKCSRPDLVRPRGPTAGAGRLGSSWCPAVSISKMGVWCPDTVTNEA